MSSEHTHVVIDIDLHRGGIESFNALMEKTTLPKTARAICVNGKRHRVIFKAGAGESVKQGKLGKGMVVKGCTADAVLDGYRLANNREPADRPQLLDEFIVGENSSDDALDTLTTDTSPPADREADLDTTEAIDMASQFNVDEMMAELTGDTPNTAGPSSTSHEAPTGAAQVVEFLRRWPSAFPHVWAQHINPTTHERGIKEGRAFKRNNLDGPATTWVDKRQRKANLYFTVNSLLHDPTSGKASKTDVDEVVALQIDIDVPAGQDQEAGVAAILQAVRSYRLPPSVIILSGGGVQAFWLLQDRIKIAGDLAKAEAAEFYGRGLEDELRALVGKLGKVDSCHNIDRVMRLPGTWNMPDAGKIKKGRKPAQAKLLEFTDVTYPLSAFTPARPKTDKRTNQQVPPDGNYAPIDENDPRLAKLSNKWKRIGVEGIYDDYNGDRSAAVMVFTIACVGAEVDDDAIGSCLAHWEIGAHVREQKGRALAKTIARTIQRAKEFAAGPEMGELNRKHFVISNMGGKCLIANETTDRVSGEAKVTFSTFSDFKNRYSNRKKTIKVEGNDRNIPLSKYWFEHPQRREYEQVVFAPGKEIPDAYNLWQGFAVKPDTDDSEAKCARYLTHIREIICHDDKELYDYVIKWMANGVKNPDQPGGVALVLRGKMGVGKGEFVRHYGRLFGRNFTPVSKPEHVTGRFNGHLGETILLYADEAFFAGNPQHEPILKALVTEKDHVIERKGIDAIRARSCLHVIMATNDDWAVPVSAGDRRFCCIEVGDERKGRHDYFNAIDEQMKNGGYEALLGFLLAVDLTGFHPEQFPRTAEHDRQRARSRHGVDALVEEICREGKVPCADSEHPDIAITSGKENGRGFDFYIEHRASTELRRMGAQSVKVAMKKDWGCTGWREPKPPRRRGIQFPPLADFRKRFEAKHGKTEWEFDIENWEQSESVGFEALDRASVQQSNLFVQP
jgi:hypothetical protein